MAGAATLGVGGDGPWERRTAILRGAVADMNPARVGLWLNATYHVQLFRHPPFPGVDHLCIGRHDDGIEFPWWDLQRIKDRLLDDGQLRWALEVFPPKLDVIDNCDLRHLWVMPKGWTSPVDMGHDGVQV